MAKILLPGFFVVSLFATANSQLLQAIAYIRGERGEHTSIEGNITFTQNDEGTVTILGRVVGLSPGKHGFHVYQIGNVYSCALTGAHFNPNKTFHGALADPERHAGDLGNIVANEKGEAMISITDKIISLTGPYTILARSVVIHEKADDLGKGGHADSLKWGHAGSRIACGVIGLLTPMDRLYDLASGVNILPWKTLVLIVAVHRLLFN